MPKNTKISSYIPELGLSLAKYSGGQLIERVGQDIIKNVVSSILCGGNVRSLTEGLTQRRITLSNAAMLVAFLNASKDIQGFNEKLHHLVLDELINHKLQPEQKIYLQWFIGLTGKSVQNVLRGDGGNIQGYLDDLERSLQNAVEQSKETFGDLRGTLAINENNYLINWPTILRLFTAIGAQTLAIRGSEKSMYGKLFEKLILGSVLSILGFELIDPATSNKSDKVFWLSQRENKRESDATLLVKRGKGVRFDIGFIGPGNTEISLDKVSRFEREMEFGRSLHYMSTIILVDRIGDGSRIVEMAKRIDGTIIQMSMAYWVKEVCKILNKNTGFEHKILTLSNDESLKYIKAETTKLNLLSYINGDVSGDLDLE